MAAARQSANEALEWASRGVAALKAGQFEAARENLSRAIVTDKHNPYYRFDLALAEQSLGDIPAAVRELCAAIRLKPDFDDASRRLSGLLARYRMDDPAVLDPLALQAAMQAPNANTQALAEAAIDLLALGKLGPLLAELGQTGAAAVATRLLAKRTAAPLSDDLLLAALQCGVNKNIALERLLTALRRSLLLELPADRFRDKAVSALALAMVRQCWANAHIWADTPQETTRVESLLAEIAGGALDDFETSRCLLLASLYRSPVAVMSHWPAGKDVAGLRPRAWRDLLSQSLQADRAEVELAAAIGSRGAWGAAVTRRVALQYEAAPYPRWSSLTLPRSGSLKPALQRFFSQPRLSFLDGEFLVLIAGCGTGRHALQSAIGYGEGARVVGIDLSARSLAYAALMAERYGVANVSFEQADLSAGDGGERQFDVIECVGVLHHLSDPFAGWKALLKRLAPGGIMLIGMYSALSRRDLTGLRAQPDYPGPGCSDSQARDYRQRLLARPAGEPGADIASSGDAHTLSEFRDLVLHEQESPVALAEIAGFLAANQLSFKGFIQEAQQLSAFQKRFPDRGSLLKLENWTLFENDNPRLFDGMYRFWCERAA